MTEPTYEHPASHAPPPRRTLHDVRAASALATARPAYAGGVRAGIATVVPLLVDQLFGTGGGAWISLAGLNGALIDRGGPYRARAVVMSALAVASAAAVLIGTLASGHLALALPVTFGVALLCGLMRVWTDVGPGFGVTVLVTYAVALAIPSPALSATFMRAAYIAIGGLWAMLVAIVLWPLRPYAPVRRSVAECYRTLADYLDDIVDGTLARTSDDPWAFKTGAAAMRTALESARMALATSRRGRSGETRRGERLLMLHEIADQMFVHAIALRETVEGEQPVELADVRDALDQSLHAMAAAMRALAERIETEHDLPRLAVSEANERLHVPAAAPAEATASELSRAYLFTLLGRITDYATTAAAITSTLASGSPIPDVDGLSDIAPAEPRNATLLSLAALVQPDSVVMQHALRVAIVTTAAVLATDLLHLNHGYWVTLTAVVILQPYVGATRQKALQRVIGTILGGVVAAGLSALFGGTAAVIVLIFVFTVCCVALLPVNYGAYAIFGTPAFVLLAESSVGDWHLAELRVVNTLIGGALALVGSRMLWPVDERNRLPACAAAALHASAAFLRRAAAVAGRRTPAVGELRDARRAVALAAANAEDAFQRVLGDGRAASDELEPVMAFLVYTRRLASSIASLALAPETGERALTVALDRFAAAVVAVLDDLAVAVTEQRLPAPFPERASILSGVDAPPLVRARARRMVRQLALLHGAVDRWVALDIARPDERAATPSSIQ